MSTARLTRLALLTASLALPGCGHALRTAESVPRSATDPGDCAAERAACAVGSACSEDVASDYLSCVEGQALALEKAGEAVRAFDRVAVALLDADMKAAEGARNDLFRTASRLALPALDDLEQMAADERWDLAARRSAFACAPWYREGRICPVDGEVARYVGGFRRYHQQKAKELQRKWPAAAAMHACIGAGEDCAEVLAKTSTKWTIVDEADYEVHAVAGKPECGAISGKLQLPRQARLGAAKKLHVEISIDACGPVTESATAPQPSKCYYPPASKKGEKVGHPDPQKIAGEKVVEQAATRVDHTATMPVAALLGERGAAKPDRITGGASQTWHVVESDRCAFQSDRAPATLEPDAAKSLSKPIADWIATRLAITTQDHLARAAEETKRGGLDAADHFMVLAALSARRADAAAEPPADVTAWFQKRWGVLHAFPQPEDGKKLVDTESGMTLGWPDVTAGGVAAGKNPRR